jgi:hypothetical protein
VDLLDFEQAELYFEESINAEVEHLVIMAAANYGNEDAELMLLRANFIAPQHLTVLIAMYRFYFYQHRLEDALLVADSTLAVVGRRLHFPESWQNLREANIGEGVIRSMGLVRLYLMVLKAAGYIHLRLGELNVGKTMLEKLVELDSHDRIGGKALLDVLHQSMINEKNSERNTKWTN